MLFAEAVLSRSLRLTLTAREFLLFLMEIRHSMRYKIPKQIEKLILVKTENKYCYEMLGLIQKC